MRIRSVLAAGAVALALAVAVAPSGQGQQRRLPADSAQVSVRTSDWLASIVEFFTGDALVRRSVGTVSGNAAAAFLAVQFAMLGLEPAGDEGSFFRFFDGLRISTEGTLVVGGAGRTATTAVGDGLVAWPRGAREAVLVDGELVFVGHGILAAEYGWDDFRDAPLDGRIVVLLAGDPGLTDTTRFRGRAGTLYGAFESKLSEAARRGARGLILLHDEVRFPEAWDDILETRTGSVVLSRQPAHEGLAFAAVMPLERFNDLLAQFGRDGDVLITRAMLPEFRPIPLGMHAVVQLRSTIEHVSGVNVVARVPGRHDGGLNEAVLVTTEYDVGDADEPARIATLVGAAGAIQGRAGLPRRSVYFVAAAGARPDGVGMHHLVVDPMLPLEQVAAVVNVGRPDLVASTPTMAGIDAYEAGLDRLLRAAAAQTGLESATWDGHPLDRLSSAHAFIAKEGVPGLTIGAGWHAPDDTAVSELPPAGSVNLTGLVRQTAAVATFIRLLADAADRPSWRAESPYRAAWERLERLRLRRRGP